MKNIDEACVEWNLSHPEADKEETWKAGANYMLEKICEIVGNNSSCERVAFELGKLIIQLKK